MESTLQIYEKLRWQRCVCVGCAAVRVVCIRAVFTALPKSAYIYCESNAQNYSTNIMARFKLTIEYEGTRYSGWQIQQNARTVQGEISSALRGVLNTKNAHEKFEKSELRFELYGSGRTDAGVHALAQVAHLEAATMLAPHILRIKLNDTLPADINILRVEKAHPKFHARFDAVSRSYLYQISRRRTAFGKKSVWWIKDELNADVMRDAAQMFCGMHDFSSFTADDPDEKSTKSLIEECRVEEAGSLILLRVRGSHFLWNMVRRIVGVLAEVGRGKLTATQARSMLLEHSELPAQLTAPPSGLFLERVYYRGDEILSDVQPTIRI